jgi:hypothetical protein
LSIDLAHFTLTSATFETRYPTAFLMWDRSGAVWQELGIKYPDLRIVQATPSQVNVKIDTKAECVVGVDKTFCAVRLPKSDLKDLCDVSAALLPAMQSRLMISIFTRIGLRLIYHKQFEERDEASSFVFSNAAMPHPKGKHFNVDGRALDPEIAVTVEDDVKGFTVRLKSQQITMNLILPPEFDDLAAVKQAQRNFVVFDIDYYVHAATPSSAFDAPALIEDWLHLIRRDTGKIFNV